MKENKTALDIGFIILCVVIICGFYFGYKYYVGKQEKVTYLDKDAVVEEPEDENAEKEEEKPLFAVEEYPKVDGSTATIPLAEAFQKEFTGADSVEIEHSKTHQAYANLVDKKADLILVVEPSEEDLEYAEEQKVELQSDKVVNEGFVFFVNKDNPVDSLTIEQIQKIYSGKITNWKEVGGNDQKIIAYQRPENSGSQTGMLNLVMKDVKMKNPETETIAESMSDIIDVVSDYDNGEASIGYSYYYYANTMYIGENVKMLKINDVEPNSETIKSEEYPIITAYYAVTRKDEAPDSKTVLLRDSMLSKKGQKVAEEAGYVPVK